MTPEKENHVCNGCVYNCGFKKCVLVVEDPLKKLSACRECGRETECLLRNPMGIKQQAGDQHE